MIGGNVRLVRWIGALAAWVALTAGAWAEPPPGARIETRGVRGLAQPAQILVDQWGVAHIYAASQRDAFFLQGYNAARDRLWQIDLWRKRGLGRLAESFGPAYVAQDRAARLFLYRGDMAREWAAYGPHAQERAQAFADGVNAFVDEVRAGARPLPVEFTLTHSLPERWRAEDIVRIRSHALTRNVSSEVERARVACASGLEADRLRRFLEPAWTPTIPDGLDPCAVPADVLADYDLATRDVSFDPLAQRADNADATLRLAALRDRALNEGSNNWVISPARSATGRPILANDPHRTLGAPSLRYIVHLNAPGLDVIGAGEPALPGVSIGHNPTIAFGLTIFSIDQEDLYVYELNPENPLQYRYQGGWENMRRVRETIRVQGGRAQTVDLLFTRHGPVLKVDAEHHRAFAMRTVWSEPGTSAYFGSIEYMDAPDWPSFRTAMAHYGAPSENMIFASTSGDIGWIGAGRAPRRRNWDGLMPAPGDGRYEWDGFLSGDELPSLYNPPQGWFASANEMNLPDGYPINERRLGFEWSNPTRALRIKAVLGANAHVSITDSMALQMDAYSTDACRMKALLPARAADPETQRALAMLRGWDCVESVGSGPAALYEVWAARHLGRTLVARVTPEPARAIVGSGAAQAVIEYLEHADPTLRADVITQSLAAAFAETKRLLGPDPAAWRWGDLHRALFTPAIARLAPPALADQMRIGPLQVRGSSSTPAAASPRASDFAASAGASFRMVLDVGDWDQSVAVNTPGQSGDPMSAHYRDLFPLWASGDYFPLLYSRGAIERAARDVIVLTPR